MKAYSYTDANGTVSGKRGFCADGKQLDGISDITLTSYIWEYLGNKMPANIYPSGVIISAPSGLSAVSTSSSTVTLTWKDNSSAETGFNIERKTGVLGVYVTVAVPSANATTCTDTGLILGTTYYYRARAYNASAYSAYSNEVSVVAGNLPFVPVVAQMDVKIIGAKDGQGIVNPDKGDTAQIQFQGNTQGNYECRIFLPTGEQVWYDRKDNVSQGVFVWSPKNMASGTYFAAIIGPGLKVKKKIVVVR